MANENNESVDSTNLSDAKHAAESSTAAQQSQSASEGTVKTIAQVAREAYEQAQAREGVGSKKTKEGKGNVVSQSGTEHSSSSDEAQPEGDVEERTDGNEGQTGEQQDGRDSQQTGQESTENETETEESQEQSDESESSSEEETADTGDVATDDGSKPPPFHKHPAFQRVVKKAEAAEGFIKSCGLDSQWDPKVINGALQAQAHHESFCQQYGIEQAEVADIMNALAQRHSNPTQARQLIDKVLSTFAPKEGAIDPDLQQKVDDKLMSLEDAKEMTQLRAQTRIGQRSQQWTARQQQVARSNAKMSAIDRWDKATGTKDPSFKPGSNLYQVTNDRFAALQATSPLVHDDGTEAVKLLEQAYAYAKKLLGGNGANGQARRAVTPGRILTSTSRSSGSGVKKEPKTIREVVAKVAAAHGMRFNPNGGG